jgi:hypothetical protein
MTSKYRRPYTLQEQQEFNRRCVENINRYWSEHGLEADAKVEKKRVFVPNAGKKGHHMWSEEIVSSVAQFPSVKRQILGIMEK